MSTLIIKKCFEVKKNQRYKVHFYFNQSHMEICAMCKIYIILYKQRVLLHQFMKGQNRAILGPDFLVDTKEFSDSAMG